jgi:hypothetical protein
MADEINALYIYYIVILINFLAFFYFEVQFLTQCMHGHSK